MAMTFSVVLQAILTLAIQLGVACGSPRPAAETGAEIPVEALLEALRESASARQFETMQTFAGQAGAPAAIPRLCDEMRKAAPALDNNIGLTLGFLLERHPAALCPLEPLLEAIERPVWTSQQKCAQALLPLLWRGDGRGRETEIAAGLIPLLASQRPRVFEAGRKCLEALTGEQLGDTPERWLAWYEGASGSALDMRAAVHEELIVLQPREGGGMRLPGEQGELASIAALRELLVPRIQSARERGLALSVSIQLPDERLKELQALIQAPDVAPLLELFLRELGIEDVVLSPMSDAFRAPWPGLAARDAR